MARPGYIVYACPTGPLAEQIDTYFAAALAAHGPNTAHEYMPHVTLTGFFEDAPEAVPRYVAALGAALDVARPRRPAPPLAIAEMRLDSQFHGLLVEAEWLRGVVAAFAAAAESPTRAEPLRLKDGLHLSLAYGFAPEQHAPLAALARELVDPRAPAGWELRFYRSHGDGAWTCYAAWAV
jgi:hypothetical protein